MNSHPQPNKPDDELTYGQALARTDDLTPFIELAQELDTMSKEGRINDMRRRLVRFSVAYADQRKAAVLSNLLDAAGNKSVTREELKVLMDEIHNS